MGRFGFRTMATIAASALSAALLAGSAASAAATGAGTIRCQSFDDPNVVYVVTATTDASGAVTAMSLTYHDNDGFDFARELKTFTTTSVSGPRLDFTGTDDAGPVHVTATITDTRDYKGNVDASGDMGEGLELEVVCTIE